jgi:hypothetical protein
MTTNLRTRRRQLVGLAMVAAVSTPTLLQAQQAEQPRETSSNLETVVVTGTAIQAVCNDTGRCDRRVADGARLPYRFDKKTQANVAAKVAEIRAGGA